MKSSITNTRSSRGPRILRPESANSGIRSKLGGMLSRFAYDFAEFGICQKAHVCAERADFRCKSCNPGGPVSLLALLTNQQVRKLVALTGVSSPHGQNGVAVRSAQCVVVIRFLD